MADYAELEAILGYHFRDPALLAQALRHASWCNEQPGERPLDSQRLEFIGDAVLGLAVGHRLMARFPTGSERDLSVTRLQIVSEAGLSEVARQLGFGHWVQLGKGEEKSGGRDKPRILADAFEAIVGAVYLDSGFDAGEEVVGKLLGDRIETVELKNFFDFKTRLQELAQARLKSTPTYQVLQELGPDHGKQFVVAVHLEGEEWGRAIGKSKKEAEQLAAAEACFRIEGGQLGRPKR
ncbi:MAG: ribonuclease III [Acidobacteriota bacterium]